MQGLRHNTPSCSLVSSRPLRVPMTSPVKLARRKMGENVGKFEESPIVFGSKPSPLTCIERTALGTRPAILDLHSALDAWRIACDDEQ